VLIGPTFIFIQRRPEMIIRIMPAGRVGYRCMTGIGMPFGQPLQMQEAGCV